jgi:hypothetical protein
MRRTWTVEAVRDREADASMAPCFIRTARRRRLSSSSTTRRSSCPEAARALRPHRSAAAAEPTVQAEPMPPLKVPARDSSRRSAAVQVLTPRTGPQPGGARVVDGGAEAYAPASLICWKYTPENPETSGFPVFFLCPLYRLSSIKSILIYI